MNMEKAALTLTIYFKKVEIGYWVYKKFALARIFFSAIVV
jgi:hypothetical protein